MGGIYPKWGSKHAVLFMLCDALVHVDHVLHIRCMLLVLHIRCNLFE